MTRIIACARAAAKEARHGDDERRRADGGLVFAEALACGASRYARSLGHCGIVARRRMHRHGTTAGGLAQVGGPEPEALAVGRPVEVVFANGNGEFAPCQVGLLA